MILEENWGLKGKANSIINTNDGGYAITGQYEEGLYVLKLNSNFQKIWEKTIVTTGDEYGYDIIQTQDGNLVVLGSVYATYNVNDGDVYVIKLSQNGEILWQKTFESNRRGFSIIETSTNDLVIAGRKDGYSNLLELSSLGEMKTDKIFNNSWVLDCIIKTMDGGYAVTGWTGYGGNFITMKLDTNFESEWVNTSQEGRAYSMVQTDDAGFVVFGDNFGTGNSIIKIDKSGNYLWTKYFCQNSGTGNEMRTIIRTKDNNLMLAGFCHNGTFKSYFAKISQSGDLLYENIFTYYSVSCGIVETSDGGFLSTSNNKNTNTKFELVKLNSNCELVWTK